MFWQGRKALILEGFAVMDLGSTLPFRPEWKVGRFPEF